MKGKAHRSPVRAGCGIYVGGIKLRFAAKLLFFLFRFSISTLYYILPYSNAKTAKITEKYNPRDASFAAFTPCRGAGIQIRQVSFSAHRTVGEIR